MIKSFEHEGLERFFTKGTKTGIQASQAAKLCDQLTFLHTAMTIDDMDIPGGDYIHSKAGRKICGQLQSIKTGVWFLILKMVTPTSLIMRAITNEYETI